MIKKVGPSQRTSRDRSNRVLLPPRASGAYLEIARRVAGPDTPSWLEEYFEGWAPSIMIDASIERTQPGRAEMRKRLQSLVQATTLIRAQLNDGATRDFLDETPAGPLQNHGILDLYLSDLADRAAHAERTLVGTDGKTKPGRSRAKTQKGLSPKVFCAAIIAEAWKRFHGQDPAASNENAARAAEALWAISGGTTRSWGNDLLKAWRHPFEDARKTAVHTLRQDMARYLEELEHQSGLLNPTEKARDLRQ